MKMIHHSALLPALSHLILPCLLLTLNLTLNPVSAIPQSQLRPRPELPGHPLTKTLVVKQMGFLINENNFAMENVWVEAHVKEDDFEFDYMADVDDEETGLLTYV